MTPRDQQDEPVARADPRRGRRGSRLRMIALLCLLTAVVVGGLVAVATIDLEVEERTLMAWLDGAGAWAPAAVVALMVVHCFVPFPAEILALCAGAAFGTALGTVSIWIGAMLGAALSFALARWLGRTAVERLLPARHRATLDDWTAERGTLALLVSRFVPVIAFNLINYAAGLTNVGWWTFLWTTGVGILPITLLVVHLGARMTELSWPMLVAVSAAAIVSVVALHRLAARR